MLKRIFIVAIFVFFLFGCKKGEVSLKRNDNLVKYEKISINEFYDKDATTDSTYCNLSFFKITEIKNDGLKDKINSDITNFILSDEEGTVYENADYFMIKYFEGYKDFCKEFPDIPQTWGMEKRANFMGVLNDTLSIEFNLYSFSGGAHPNYFTTYANYNLNSGEKLTVKDIVYDGKYEELVKIAEEQLKKDKEIEAGFSLADLGYYFPEDTFYLPDNFLIKEKSIFFYFNIYEVAPYVLGPTEIEISFDKLTDIINFDSL
ncbi:MAG TPA: DUF3298 domain-containing protein [Spirochaetota bacterium]|nr:DUF3298 domain-containing protein [Spirochaetota bacterium]